MEVRALRQRLWPGTPTVAPSMDRIGATFVLSPEAAVVGCCPHLPLLALPLLRLLLVLLLLPLLMASLLLLLALEASAAAADLS